ncbi:hypothetical protein [Dyella monticola]|uniref:hypothetical protein n=1 Tax=Dyella monticola TaxID=1927958 RepID=UPI0011C0521B|nr:hypothetical protein [Dyella monticola]
MPTRIDFVSDLARIRYETQRERNDTFWTDVFHAVKNWTPKIAPGKSTPSCPRHLWTGGIRGAGAEISSQLLTFGMPPYIRRGRNFSITTCLDARGSELISSSLSFS